MRDLLLNMLAKQAGLPHLPKDQKEFFSMVANSPQFNSDLKKAENMGILKRNNDGTLNIIDKDKVDSIVQNFVGQILFRK